ncbi:hypothetical protein XINFAN_04083 [Pseudogemmobacter humi]|uniref:Uncharacterized protein n=1 Tax=Pseudogemmobacter humi TaxID=2483812 RepID=A0A3P5XSR6_9RHOB|nr:hypothetical protein XINFAN_04083 [Pseudogemmobacter humi]
MDWISLIVPVMGGAILIGGVVVAWVSIRSRGQKPPHKPGKRSRISNRHINPKTGSY